MGFLIKPIFWETLKNSVHWVGSKFSELSVAECCVSTVCLSQCHCSFTCKNAIATVIEISLINLDVFSSKWRSFLNYQLKNGSFVCVVNFEQLRTSLAKRAAESLLTKYSFTAQFFLRVPSDSDRQRPDQWNEQKSQDAQDCSACINIHLAHW